MPIILLEVALSAEGTNVFKEHALSVSFLEITLSYQCQNNRIIRILYRRMNRPCREIVESLQLTINCRQ